MRILLVEDELDARTAMTRVLNQEGYEVFQAFAASEAMRLLQKEKIDVVLLDIMLGDGEQTGWAVAGFMQVHEELRSIPVIVVSGMEPEEIRSGAKSYVNTLSRAAIILGKPVDGAELIRTIKAVAKSE